MTDTLATAALTSTTPITRNPFISMLACARARHARARPTEQAYTTASHRAVRAAATQARVGAALTARGEAVEYACPAGLALDLRRTRINSSHPSRSYAVFRV